MIRKIIRPRNAVLVFSFVAGGIFLLLPMTSKRFDISVNQQALQQKEAHLEQIRRQADSIPASEKPNIIIITADDLGWTDISLYGSPHLETTYIDLLAEQGATFSNGYATSAICSPSRAGTLTGRYQQRFGYEMQPQNQYPANRLQYYAFKYLIDTDHWKVNANMEYPTREAMMRQGLPVEEFTLGELLQANGYATASIGKWHLGHHETLQPTKRGFGHMYGFYEAFTLFADTNATFVVNQQHNDFSNDYIWGKERNGLCAIRRDEQEIQEERYLTDALADEAIAFIEANKDQPFFLYLPFSAPHTPFQATKTYFDQFSHIQDRNKRVYYAMIKQMDDAIGNVMAKIDSLGLSKNTLICFASDNGGATYTQATDNAPLAGGKMSHFEGGIRVPFVMRWTDHIPAGTQFAHPVTLMDFFGTAVQASQTPLPADRKFDGKDLIPFLNGEISSPPHQVLFWKAGPSSAIRKGKWKMILDESRGYYLLFDLEKDIEEKQNLYDQYPEIVEELTPLLEAWEAELAEPLWPNIMDFETQVDGQYFYFPA